jgi:hypothetical protein
MDAGIVSAKGADQLARIGSPGFHRRGWNCRIAAALRFCGQRTHRLLWGGAGAYCRPGAGLIDPTGIAFPLMPALAAALAAHYRSHPQGEREMPATRICGIGFFALRRRAPRHTIQRTLGPSAGCLASQIPMSVWPSRSSSPSGGVTRRAASGRRNAIAGAPVSRVSRRAYHGDRHGRPWSGLSFRV